MKDEIKATRIDFWVSRLSHRYPARLGRLSQASLRFGILVAAAHLLLIRSTKMNHEADESDEFLLMGTYSIVDARKLLAAFESHGVDHRVEFRDGAADIVPALSYFGGAFGQAAQATVRVAPNDKELADQIHTDLFGDCLPNYESSFFSNSDAPKEPDEPV